MITHSTLHSPTIMTSFTSWIDALRKILVDGYNAYTFDTVVISGGVATCTRSAGFSNFSTDGVAAIAGVTGVFPVLTISGNVMTLDCTGVANQSLSAVVVKIPPVGYTEYFTGNAGLVVRRGTDNAYFKFEASGSSLVFNAYESMTNYTTGTNMLHASDITLSIGSWATTARFVCSDEAGQTMFNFGTSVSGFSTVVFGKLPSFLAGDVINTIFSFNATSGIVIKFLKNYTGQVNAIAGSVSVGSRTVTQDVYPNIEGGISRELVTFGENVAAPYLRRGYLAKIHTVPERLPIPVGYDFLVDGADRYIVVFASGSAGSGGVFRLIMSVR